MKIVVFGATGNVGSSVVSVLGSDERVDEIVGVARRKPTNTMPKTTWVSADISSDDLDGIVKGADAVIDLAWLIQPSRKPDLLERVNVDGTRRVFEAVARNNVPVLVYASSVGAYSKGPKDRAIDESWPTGGVHTSIYSMQKARVERILDTFVDENPKTRVVRLRPGLIFKAEVASEIKGYFLGPAVPWALLRLLRFKRLPLVPTMPELVTQIVSSDDVGNAYRQAVFENVSGAFNIAADPIIDTKVIARLFHAKRFPLSAKVVRCLASITYHLRIQPTDPGWVDMGTETPLMDTSRAKNELKWEAKETSVEAMSAFIDGFAHQASGKTPPLSGR